MNSFGRKTVELPCFSYACEAAHRTLLYLGPAEDISDVQVAMICSELRVVPIHTVSVPRLERTAAVPSTHMAFQLEEKLLLRTDVIFYWADNMSHRI